MFKELILNLLTFFKWVLFARLIIDYVRMFARNWRPKSGLIALFEVIYAITDPPMNSLDALFRHLESVGYR